MRKRLAQITLVLVIVVALPVALFFARSISELSDNEKMVRKVFDKQLQSILYSLNQHTETLFGLWSSRLDMAFYLDSATTSSLANELIWKNPSIVAIKFNDLEKDKELAAFGQVQHPMVLTIKPDRLVYDKLVEYLESGYQKVASSGGEEGTLLYFMLSEKKQKILCQIWIDPEVFITRNMSLIIQQVSQDLFQISVSGPGNVQTAASDSTQYSGDRLVSQPSWYLPGYTFSIRLKSKTIDELVSERTKKNNVLLMLTLFVVMIGGGFVVFALRREMHLAELKSDFVSNVSHELRTPLALVNMYAETLLLGRLKDQSRQKEYLNVIHHEAQRLSDMVNRILSFSRMERGKREYHLSINGINDLVAQVAGLYQPNFELNKVAVKLNLLPAEKYINADREAVVETLVNLFDNAVNYGPEQEKTVRIGLLIKNEQLIIEVEDNGIGIAPKDIKKIFDKFYRVTKGNLANRVKGSGLGLNIVQQIMTYHKGKVTVESRLGQGSCFRLHFPLVERE